MNRKLRQLEILALSVALGCGAATPALADDTEIYTGANNTLTTVDPNVLFIIDTSASMGEIENQATTPYDPSRTYAGDCDTDFIYWSTTGDAPACDTAQRFTISSNRCQAAVEPLFNNTSGTGTFQDRVARFKPAAFFEAPSWINLSGTVQNPDHVECQADEGEHGETAASAAKFIQDNVQPYVISSVNKRNWNDTGEFVSLFSANFINYRNTPNNITPQSRISIVRKAVQDLIRSSNNMNVGVMRYNPIDITVSFVNGGTVSFPFEDIDDLGVKDRLINHIGALPSRHPSTPLAETMSEALRVFRGDRAKYGLLELPFLNFPISLTPSAAFDSGTFDYNSPLDVQCQKNFIVYLTDGDPTGDGDADSFVNSTLVGASLPTGDTTCGFPGDDCLDELAEFMAHTDLVPGLDGQQSVVTYTIGFGTDASADSTVALLRQTASKSGGKSFVAKDYLELASAFTQIINEIQSVNSTFTAPAVSVNAFNRITNREELYFTLFKPSENAVWGGNLKRYRIAQAVDATGNPIDADGDGEADTPQVLDATGNPAVNEQTGFFDKGATSFWTTVGDAPDGDETSKGGAARLFGGGTADPALSRTIYTNFGSTPLLTDASNQVVTTNLNLTSTLLGLTGAASEPSRETLLKWLSGVDVKDEDGDLSDEDARRFMGDPLHTKPLLLEYAPAPTAAQPNPTSDITIFMMTNEGIMHAIDADTGGEVFSFIPKEHLAKAATYFENPTSGSKEYGLDGPLSVFFKDDNNNGFLDTDAGSDERYILVFGERRGGRRLYAIDVTDRAAPEYLWTITGGTGDFHELGQTWSSPIQSKIKLDGDIKDVLLFAGGYDPRQDTVGTARSGDLQGRAIYMVNAESGELLWWAGREGAVGTDPLSPVPADLTTVCAIVNNIRNCSTGGLNFSLASDLRVIDLDGDGLADRVYGSDTGGQIIRIDFDNEGNTGAADLAEGYIVADLQRNSATDVPLAADNRRFYFPPDVALFTEDVDTPFLSIAIGSGYRSHPLNLTVEDRFYMVQDKNPFSKPEDYPNTVFEDDLKDVTSDLSPDLTGFEGWFIQLADDTGAFVGEKVLASATTFSGTILFTTFSPVAGASAGSCAPNQGTGQVFAVSAIDATPTPLFTIAPNSTSSQNSRVVASLTRTGIPPEVTILFPPAADPSKPVALVAAEKLELPLPNTPEKTYWFEQEK